MKLLFVLPEYVGQSGGGIITFYRNFLPRLVVMGHQVDVIVGSGLAAWADSVSETFDGVNVRRLDEKLLRKYWSHFHRYTSMPTLRQLLAGAWAMRELAANGDGYDLVEVVDWGLLFIPWVVERGPPCVVQLHGSSGQITVHDPVRGEDTQSALLRLIEVQGFDKAKIIQAYSQGNIRYWERQIETSIQYFPPAWEPLGEATEMALKKSTQGLVVGRVQRWKGPQMLCEALRIMGESAPQIRWIGRDTAFDERNRKTSEYLQTTWPKIWGRLVQHTPQLSFEETAVLQGRADFVIVPSLWDTFNFTCVEAMAAGTLTICSTGAGACELIENGVNGFTFEKNNPEALADVLLQVIKLSERDKYAIRKRGRQTVLSALDPENIGNIRIESYQQAISAGGTAGLDVDDWLRLAVEPDTHARDMAPEFLDHLPLKFLTGYSMGRILKKLGLK